jgi:hypothetical protein
MRLLSNLSRVLCAAHRRSALLCLLTLATLHSSAAIAQTVNASQQVVLEGLRSANGKGNFTAAAVGPNGHLYLLLDQGDGIRLLESDSTGASLLAQTQTGAAGDSGVAMALDPAGNIYVTGTTTSSTLTGTSGVVYPHRADSSINSFLAKYDANLNLVFLTFLGSGRTAASGVAATADAVFVTGITFNAAFPVSAAGLQQMPALGSTENGFVERFFTDGTVLAYATYLTGAKGDTIPAAIVADSANNAYVTGATSASGYPTIAALQPNLLLAAGVTTSGFLTKLTPAGDGFTFSTYIAGEGITGLALDASTSSLLLTGNISLGQFPVATVAMPLTSATYQTLLRIPLDGQSVSQSVLLAEGNRSYVSAASGGSAWVSGGLTVPLFPGAAPPDYNTGDSFLLHVTANGSLDQTLRFGGAAVNNAAYAGLSSVVAGPAVGPAAVYLPGTIHAQVTTTLLATQRFDLPLVGTASAVLPNAVHDLLPTAAQYGTSTVCNGTGAWLAAVATSTSAPALSLSTDDLPNLTLRNLGSAAATGLILSVSGFSYQTDCGATLNPSSLCNIVLTGPGPGAITVTAANAASVTESLAPSTAAPDAIGLSVREADFGVVTPSQTEAQTITVTNLSTTAQTFASAADAVTNSGYVLTQTATNCGTGGGIGTLNVPAGASCSITLQLALASGASSGPVRAAWKVGTRDVLITGFLQSADLSISATEVDFGTVTGGSPAALLPRYLYLSNNGGSAMAHSSVGLPPGAPFEVTDDCPSQLEPGSVCRIALVYAPASTTSVDSVTLRLDEGLSVLVTGSLVPKPSVSGSATNPSIAVSSSALSFGTPVVVTGISSTTQTLTVSNTGASASPLLVAVAGDFALTNGCPAVLGGGASCSVLVSFAPSQPGERSGLISLSTGGSFSPTYVSLTGTGLGILPPNNGSLTVGQTYVEQPVVAWFQVQQAVTSLTVSSSSSSFGVVLVANSANGHGTPPASAFTQTATAGCADCWLGIQMTSASAGTPGGTLTLSTVIGGNPYLLTVAGTVLPSAGLLLTPMQDFGSVAAGSLSGSVNLAMTNALSPSASVTIQSVQVSGDFLLLPASNGGAACNGVLAATATCFMQVVFSPVALGERTGTLTITTSGGAVSSKLTGFGLMNPGVAIQPTSLDFESVPGSAATQQSVTISNTSAGPVTVGQPVSSDPSFTVSSTCGALLPGMLCTVLVDFTPQAGNVSSVLSMPVTAVVNGQSLTQIYTIALSGNYAAVNAGLEILPNQVDFGAGAVGQQGGLREFTLNNLSMQSLNVRLQMPRNFPLGDLTNCSTLPAGASCSFSVTYLPGVAGAATGTVFAQGISSSGAVVAQTLSYMLGYGSSSGTLSVNYSATGGAPLDFGQVTSGQQLKKTVTLSNSGTAPLTVRRLVSEPPYYSSSNCGALLPPGASCTATITYAPINEIANGSSQTSGRSDAGTLVIESDAASSPDVADLTGVAVPVTSPSPASPSVLAAYSLSQGALTFASTQVGSASAAQFVTLTNTGTIALHITSVVTPQDFTAMTTCSTLLPGSTCDITVQFTPTTSGSAVRSGAVEILTDASDSLEYISVVGVTSAAALSLSPASLDFGDVDLGRNATLPMVVTNGSAAPVMFTGLSATGDFSAVAGNCPANGSALAASASCTLQVTFSPASTGTRNGVLSLTNHATSLPLTAALTGFGIQPRLQVSPVALSFGSIAEGATAQLTLTLTNTGTVAVTGITTSLSGPNATDFAVTVPCAQTTLTPGQSCVMTVSFTPSSTGSRSVTLAVNSSDPNGPQLVALNGNGVQGGSFLLTVNGASSATATVTAGSPAVYALTLTPVNGFTGAVALTCAPVVAAQYASCSLLSSALTLNGAAQASTATINTITSHARSGLVTFGAMLLLPLGFWRRKKLRFVVSALMLVVAGMVSGCGGGRQMAVLKTPPGTYQYTVTASSTTGLPVSSSVTLYLVVQ